MLLHYWSLSQRISRALRGLFFIFFNLQLLNLLLFFFFIELINGFVLLVVF